MKLSIISRSVPPYRVHLHRRLSNEIPGVSLSTLVTHDVTDGRWSVNVDDSIDIVTFSARESGGAACLDVLDQFLIGGRILDWVARNNVDAVIVWGYADLGRVRTILGLKQMGIPCFLAADSNVRGDCNVGVHRWVKSILIPLLLRQCTGVMPFGRLGRDYFSRYGVDVSRMFTAPLEPDYQVFSKSSEAALGEAREQFGLHSGRRRFIFSGRLVAEKQVARLIYAFARVADERPQWDLVIVGDGEMRATLEGLVNPEYVRRVTWLGHVSDTGRMAAIYHAADVLVLPSEREPWGLVVNEATAAGLAVVCSDMVGAGAELVRHGVNGYVYPWSSTDGLAEAMRNVSDDRRIDAMKSASIAIVQAWRRDADPVAGVVQALRYCGAFE